MNFDDSDGELAELIQRPDSDMLRVIPRGVANNNGRVNPVQRQLRREQPQQPPINPFINHRTPGAMPSNGGRKRKRTTTHSKKYKNKTYYKNKNRKRQHYTRRIKRM